MTEKELRHLSRSELIEMLIDEIRESDELRARLTAAEEKLNARELSISEAGTLAEAAMRLSGVNSHRLLIRGHRVSDRPGRTVRVTADATRIEPSSSLPWRPSPCWPCCCCGCSCATPISPGATAPGKGAPRMGKQTF